MTTHRLDPDDFFTAIGEREAVLRVQPGDTVIVQTPQITLVCPISEAERIKELVAEVTTQLGGSYA